MGDSLQYRRRRKGGEDVHIVSATTATPATTHIGKESTSIARWLWCLNTSPAIVLQSSADDSEPAADVEGWMAVTAN